MGNIYEGLNKFYIWIYRLMIANVLWIYFSLNGLLVVGIFPSTSALFAICRKWIRKEDFSVFNTYKYYFKKDFKNANILGYIMLAITVIIYFDYMYFSSISAKYSLFLSYLFLFLTVIDLIAFLVMYSIYNHYDMSIKDNVKFALIYPFSNIMMSLLLMIVFCLVVYFAYTIMPILSIFMGISSPILLVVLITNISFNEITRKQIRLQY